MTVQIAFRRHPGDVVIRKLAFSQPVIDKIVAGFNKVMKIPSVREALQKQTLQPVEPMNADELAELYAADTEKYAKIIREANIKIPE